MYDRYIGKHNAIQSTLNISDHLHHQT